MASGSDWYWELLLCPDCGRSLSAGGRTTCACGFAASESTPLDLRPQHPSPRTLELHLGSTARDDLQQCRVERPPNRYSGPRAVRDSSELFSAAQPWMKEGARLLDLGCGPRDQAAPAAHCGLLYVGVDYSSSHADLLVDAHSIPFCSDTFDIVLSYAVLEHLYNPFLALREVARVLRPGGVFVGTVSQGEPFHDSYFHHTSFGLLDALRSAGLSAVQLWPNYDTLHALSTMGRYPRAQRLLIELVHRLGRALPILAPRKFFGWTAREKAVDELHRAAGICFVSEKAP